MRKLKLFFRPADTELKAFAEMAALATKTKGRRLDSQTSSISEGDVHSIGSFLDQRWRKACPESLENSYNSIGGA
jgi:hypothetical protein